VEARVVGIVTGLALLAGCSEDRGMPGGNESGVHPAGYASPSSSNFHGKALAAAHWAPMLDPNDPDACGACHEGVPAHATGVTGSAPGAPACTTCHSEPEGVLACDTCHDYGTSAAHPAHVSPAISEPIGCGTCHIVPSNVLDPSHLDAPVNVTFSGLATARGAEPSWDGTSCIDVACHGANLNDPAAVPRWTDTSGQQSKCGACHGIPPSEHTPSTECNRSDCHGSEVSLDVDGVPSITQSGLHLHVDGIIEAAGCPPPPAGCPSP
jgi:predicted CxxxxCH...CXXCH cytochrome family protein